MLKLGEKSKVLGASVLLVAVIVHFVLYMSIYGAGKGFMDGLSVAIGLIILGLFTAGAYMFATKRKELVLTGYFNVLSVLIIAGILMKVYEVWVKAMIGL